MQTLTLTAGELVQIREALKLTPQPDTDRDWEEAWRKVRDALAAEVDDQIARRGESR